MQAIELMQSGQMGSIEIYKEFADKLAPIISQLYQDIFEQQRLPQTMTQAIISVLLKKDKDPLLGSSYRPMILSNYEYKIVTKILGTHIDSLIPTVIDPDQMGFILDGDYSRFPFKKEPNTFTYLGIKVTHKMENLEKHNFKSVLEQTKQDLGNWSTLPISLADSINIVKMTVLLRLWLGPLKIPSVFLCFIFPPSCFQCPLSVSLQLCVCVCVYASWCGCGSPSWLS